MNIAAVIVVFVIWWWVAFLAVLPMGVKGRWEEDGDDGVDGADPGAPSDPHLKKKALRATVIATGLTAITAGIIVSGVFNFRD